MSLDETNPHEPSFAERWVADFRLVALQCARSYGTLALGALIALNGAAWLKTGAGLFVVGALAGVVAAFAAYLNFQAIVGNRRDEFVTFTLYAAIGAGVVSALVFFTVALAV